MAKVTAPLMSMSASGQLGQTLVFDKRGRVRQYVVPANPQTSAQQLVRDSLGDIQRELKLLGAVLRAELKSGFGYTWNSQIVGELMQNGQAAYTAYAAEYAAFDSGQKTAWGNADGATPVEKTDGELLYCVASAVYDMAIRLSLSISLTLPAGANAATVGAEWTANS